MDQAQALLQLKSMCAFDKHPVLDEAAVSLSLDTARIADVSGNPPSNTINVAAWAASTEFTAGTVIKVGSRWWRALVTATTGATAPSWPDLDGWPIGVSRVIDGDQTWADNGAGWAGKWDLRKAAAAAWDRKAGLAAGDYTFGTGDQTFDRSKVIEQCLRMARRYRAGVTVFDVERC